LVTDHDFLSSHFLLIDIHWLTLEREGT
jgi:hypothetical protein